MAHLIDIESVASIMHDIWSNWYIYQRDNSTPENIERWNKQSITPYSELSEEDKEKDRKQARKITHEDRVKQVIENKKWRYVYNFDDEYWPSEEYWYEYALQELLNELYPNN